MLKRLLSVSRSNKEKELLRKKPIEPNPIHKGSSSKPRTVVLNPSVQINLKNTGKEEHTHNHTNPFENDITDKKYIITEVTNHNGNLDIGEDNVRNLSPSSITLDDTIAETREDIETTLLFPKKTALLPFGNGSNKIYGYENFGNTCYCNSVLQCLYHLEDFRTMILESPQRPEHMRPHRKLTMEGNSPRIFTKESFEGTTATNSSNMGTSSSNTNNRTTTSNYSADDSSEYSASITNESSKAKEKENNRKSMSFRQTLTKYGSEAIVGTTLTTSGYNSIYNGTSVPKKKDDKRQNQSRGNEHIHTIIMSSDVTTEKLHDGCKTIIVGRNLNDFASNKNNRTSANNATSSPKITQYYPLDDVYKSDVIGRPKSENQNKDPVVSGSKPPVPTSTTLESNVNNSIKDIKDTVYTSEQRKKAALIRGPILNIDHMTKVTAKPNLYNSIKDIFECITENEYLTGIVSPTQFVKILKKENVLFNTTMQQDAHEFLNFLLNELDEYIGWQTENVSPEVRSFVLNQFQGTVINKIKCLTCDTMTSNDEPFLDFPIEIKDREEEIDIQEMLESYHQREILNGSNKFYCNQCCGLQEAERLVGLKKLPKTLAIHLKRFKYVEEQNVNIKLFNKIRYPPMLTVTSSFDASISKTYELSGLVIHLGSSPQHGHYVSLCKSKMFGWLLFDDETIESVDESTVLRFTGDTKDQSTAYVLFYKEVNSENDEHDTESENIISTSNLKCKMYENNVDQLIKCDELIRETERRERKERRERLKIGQSTAVTEGDLIDDNLVVRSTNVNHRKSSSSSNKSKRKSRILSFMKS